MKTALIVLLAVFAMAAAQGRRGPNGVNVVDNSEPQINIDPNFDNAFYRPSNPPAGHEPINNGPEYVNNNRPYQSPHNGGNPYARGGK